MLALALSSTLVLAAAPPALASPPQASTHAAAPSAREVLPFIADDYPKALALAQARKLPLFIEAWAPW